MNGGKIAMSVWRGETEGENDDWWGQGVQVTSAGLGLLKQVSKTQAKSTRPCDSRLPKSSIHIGL